MHCSEVRQAREGQGSAKAAAKEAQGLLENAIEGSQRRGGF
jgi:hypothetical protein